MNRRAATALRFLAVVYILSTVKTIVVGLLRDMTFAKLTKGDWAAYEPESYRERLMDRLHTISTVSTWATLALIALMVVGFVMLVMALERNRGLVIAGIVLLGGYVVYLLYAQLNPQFLADIGAGGHTGLRLIWIGLSAVFSIAAMLPLIAVAREARGWENAGLAIAGAIAFIVLPIGLDAFVIFAEKYSTAWQWVYRLIDVANTVWFVTFSLRAARILEQGSPEPVAPSINYDGASLDPAPLRAIGWTILFRVLVGFAMGIATIAGSMNGSYEALSSAAIGSTVIGALSTLFLIGGLAGYAKYPTDKRSDALYAVMAMLLISLILDIVGAKTTASLYGLVDKAQHAGSMWSMPSISDLESMQATAVWTGRLSLILALVSILMLLGSLGTTARAVGAEHLARTASVTTMLAMLATFGALVIGWWMPHVKRRDEGVLILAAIVLLVVAVSALANLLRVVFGVANAVERPNGAEPLPAARVVER